MRHDLSGIKFGKLLAIEPTAERRERTVMWRCQCDCGNERLIRASTLVAGTSRSCGCSQLGKKRHLTHGHSSNGKISGEYSSWTEMKRRCLDSTRHDYHRYGGRGIRVCMKWRKSFAAFLAHVGPKPSARHSIDRYPNNDGDYKPGNVRWATPKQQANNKRRGT